MISKTIINLNHLSLTLATQLKQNPTRVVTQAERLALQQQAESNDSYAAYARSLYYLLTNVLVLPADDGLPSINRSRIDRNENKAELYTIGPNPVSNFINVNIANRNFDYTYSFEIYNIYGALVEKGILINQDNIINISKVENGLNVIKILRDNKLVEIEKFVSTN